MYEEFQQCLPMMNMHIMRTWIELILGKPNFNLAKQIIFHNNAFRRLSATDV